MIQGFLNRTEERRSSMDVYMKTCQTNVDLQHKLLDLHQSVGQIREQNKTEMLDLQQRYETEIRELRQQHKDEVKELQQQHRLEVTELRQQLKHLQIENSDLRQQHREEMKELRQELKEMLQMVVQKK